MHIYRIFRRPSDDYVPVGAVLFAIVVAATRAEAVALVRTQETDEDQKAAWPNDAATVGCTLLGPTLDQATLGQQYGYPYILGVHRKGDRGVICGA